MSLSDPGKVVTSLSRNRVKLLFYQKFSWEAEFPVLLVTFST